MEDEDELEDIEFFNKASELVDTLFDIEVRSGYRQIEELGEKAYSEDSPLLEVEGIQEYLSILIKYFEECEEYEKCSVLKNVLNYIDIML